MLEIGRMWSITSQPLFPDPIWPKVVAPDMIQFMDQIKLFDI